MKKTILAAIRLYRIFVSPVLVQIFGGGCKYNPTCSVYSYNVISEFGVKRGSFLALVRILKCNPFSSGNSDSVSTQV